MFFNTTNEQNIYKIYSTERPYVTKYLSNNLTNHNKDLFVPTILSDLVQIVTYFTSNTLQPFTNSENYEPFDKILDDNIDSDIWDVLKNDKLVELHHTNLELCINAGIMNFNDGSIESRWDDLVDTQLDFLEQNSSKSGKLAIKQLLPAADIIKKYAYKEQLAYENGEHLFCRFSPDGYNYDAYKCQIKKGEKLSFGDSLLSGYIKDGMNHSDLFFSTKGACTLNYYDLHKQGLQVLELGSFAPSFLEDYLQHVPTHELYTAKLDNNLLNDLQEDTNAIYIPDIPFTVSSSSCFHYGEWFHPRIAVSADFNNLIDVIPIFSDVASEI